MPRRARATPDLDSPPLVFQANLLHGQVLLAVGERDQAHGAFETARAALETLRGNLRSEELKIAFVENRLEVYEHLVELCLGAAPTSAGRPMPSSTWSRPSRAA